MAKTNFDYEAAKNAGYSDEEITQHLSTIHPKFDIKGASESGYTPEEINRHLSTYESEEKQTEPNKQAEPEKQERTTLAKGGRVAAQYGLGLLESQPAAIAYDISVAPLASKEAQNVAYREMLSDERENLELQKSSGRWTEEDEKHLQHINEQINDPRKSMEYAQTLNVSIRDLAEKATGVDLTPEDLVEKAAHWTGFIKDPKKLFELGKTGFKPGDIIKAIAPSGRETLRGLGAGTALQMAETGNFGPIGTMAAAVVGDILGGGTASLAKGAKRIVTEPRQVLAEVAAKFAKKDKLNLQKQLIQDFRESNLQADIGTITDSDLVKWIQSRLAQSGLTGKALDDLKDQLTTQVKEEYKSISNSLGEAKFATSHEAGEVAKEGIKKIRDADLEQTRTLYKTAEKEIGEAAAVDSKRLENEILRIEKSLEPGSVKSTEQNAVLDIIGKIKRDIYDSEGNLLYAKVKDLMNNKAALNDIINYETQGGVKQLLKGLVSEMDRAIISYGKENPKFAKNYIMANKRFSQHAKTFRNRSANQILKLQDPAQLMNKMNSVQGIRDVASMMNKTNEGKEIFNGLKRLKLDDTIGKNLVDSTTQQIKLGTFSKLMEKGKNREIIKEILGPEVFKRLEKLQKNTGKLAETAQKFLNSSKTGVTLEDAGVVAKVLTDLGNLMIGNPWPLIKTGTGVAGSRYLTKLIADPEFLKLVEEAILASDKNNVGLMTRIGTKIAASAKPLIGVETNEEDNENK